MSTKRQRIILTTRPISLEREIRILEAKLREQPEQASIIEELLAAARADLAAEQQSVNSVKSVDPPPGVRRRSANADRSWHRV